MASLLKEMSVSLLPTLTDALGSEVDLLAVSTRLILPSCPQVARRRLFLGEKDNPVSLPSCMPCLRNKLPVATSQTVVAPSKYPLASLVCVPSDTSKLVMGVGRNWELENSVT